MRARLRAGISQSQSHRIHKWRVIFGLVLCAGLASPAQAQQQTSAGTIPTTHTAPPVMPGGLVMHRENPQIPRDELPETYDITCRLLFDVGTEGYPEKVQASGCDDPFRSASEKAGMNWRFRRTKKDGAWAPYKYTAQMVFRQLPEGKSVIRNQSIRITKTVLPILPQQVRNRYVDGPDKRIRCEARVHVNPRGVPYAVTILEGPWDLYANMEWALMQWRFEPVLQYGVPRPFHYDWKAVYQGL